MARRFFNKAPRNSNAYIVAQPLGSGGIVMVISPDGPRLSELFGSCHDFTRSLLNYAVHCCEYYDTPCQWLAELFYEDDISPTADGIRKTADLSASVFQALAEGREMRRFPRFYLTE